MSQTVSVTEFARSFAEYINRVVYRRESFVLVRGKKRIAEIRPLAAGRRLSDLPELVAGLPHLSPADADRFAADLDAARAALADERTRDPWQS